MGNRNLYLKTISVEEAYEKYMNALEKANFFLLKDEIIKTEDSLNRVTSKAVFAKCNSPLFNASAMDGICVDSKKTKNASEENPVILKKGKDYQIVDTGDCIKDPFDAVIMAEDVIEIDDNSVKITEPVSSWNSVRPIGEDIVCSEMIIESKYKIKPIDIGAMIASGNLEINCIKKVNVGIIPTGTEIIDPKENPKEGDIIDSNSYMIKALVEDNNAIGKRYSIVKDDYELIKAQILKSVEENDITIINAGSSAGTEDFTVHILRKIGDVIVHGVSIKPGKPVILAIVNNKPVIGLPGYPVSAYIAFDLFVKPVLDKLSGIEGINNKYIDAIVSKRIVSSLKHREYVRVKLGKVNDKFIASPLNRGAASQMSMVKADGLLVIPIQHEGVEAGELCKVKLFKSEELINNTLVSIGSHDVLMDIVSDIMANENSKYSLSSTHVGSLGGLMALKRGETVIAPTHLLSEKDGSYNVEIIKEIFDCGKVSLIKGFDRIQGLIVKKGNPLNIKSIEDLKKVKFVNRQRGAGTRVLFDYKLKTLGIDPKEINGYEKEVATHMAVACCVKDSNIDCGMGVKSAADSMGLDFIEVGVEEYDFAIFTKDLELDKVKTFLEIIKGNTLRKKLEALGGYGFTNTGKIINI